MEYRVENKYLVTDAELLVIGSRLGPLMRKDMHQTGSAYEVRSVYFDDAFDSCMEENESGTDRREKYRVRSYGADSDILRLEIKEKQRGLTKKQSCRIQKGEFEELLQRRPDISPDDRKPLNKLYLHMRCSDMRPKALIVYERTAFVYPAGNVRITFDRNILASPCCAELLSPSIRSLVPVLPEGVHVLEVKYDELLPEFIASQLEVGCLRRTAFSKYYLGRIALEGQKAELRTERGAYV